jgi:alpha-D-ribose 1-methylphosphonate 5-triphosphate synthase subunit PhnG
MVRAQYLVLGVLTGLIGMKNSGKLFKAGETTLGRANITDRFRDWISGYADVSECAI